VVREYNPVVKAGRVIFVAAVTAASCGGGGALPADAPVVIDASPDAPPVTDNPNDPELPPRGEALLMPWIAAGYYKAWACEPSPHGEVFPSNHGPNRTCTNSILEAVPAGGIGNYPLNVASVKELYGADMTTIIGYAVDRKINDLLGDGWYWYEDYNGQITADGMATEMIEVCTACHQCAPRDFVYAIAPP
jgi:hypothetical protein